MGHASATGRTSTITPCGRSAPLRNLGRFVDVCHGEKKVSTHCFLGFGKGSVNDATAARAETTSTLRFERMTVLDLSHSGEAIVPFIPLFQELLGRSGDIDL